MKFLMKQAITAKLKLELSDRQQQLSQTTNNSDNSTRIRKIGGGRKKHILLLSVIHQGSVGVIK